MLRNSGFVCDSAHDGSAALWIPSWPSVKFTFVVCQRCFKISGSGRERRSTKTGILWKLYLSKYFTFIRHLNSCSVRRQQMMCPRRHSQVVVCWQPNIIDSRYPRTKDQQTQIRRTTRPLLLLSRDIPPKLFHSYMVATGNEQLPNPVTTEYTVEELVMSSEESDLFVVDSLQTRQVCRFASETP